MSRVVLAVFLLGMSVVLAVYLFGYQEQAGTSGSGNIFDKGNVFDDSTNIFDKGGASATHPAWTTGAAVAAIAVGVAMVLAVGLKRRR